MHYLRGVARATMRMPSAAVFGYGPKTILSHRIYPPVAFIAEHRDILDQGAHSADPDYSDYAEAMGLVSPKKGWRSLCRNHSISPERHT